MHLQTAPGLQLGQENSSTWEPAVALQEDGDSSCLRGSARGWTQVLLLLSSRMAILRERPERREPREREKAPGEGFLLV